MSIMTVEGQVALLLGYIMKWYLWQFHSRAWDRERQNEGILRMLSAILCEEPVEFVNPDERCYYADALVMSRDFNSNFPWFANLSKEETKVVVAALKKELDRQTITESLNKELTNPQY
ncbi:MAG: Fe-only/vanadium nitrogenase subunit delta [Ethanoligenens sp.]